MERLLPFNTSELEQSLEQVHAHAIDSIPMPVSKLWNPDHCPEQVLPWLAWALSVENWETDWDESLKRSVIAESVTVHRKKGTLASIRRVLDAIRIRFELDEWFEYGGEPHTFRLTTSANEHWEQGLPAADAELFSILTQAVDSVKPVRSHYRVFVKVDSQSELALGNSGNAFTVLKSEFIPQFNSGLEQVALSVAATIDPVALLMLRLDPSVAEAPLPLVGVGRLRTVSLLNQSTRLSAGESKINASLALQPLSASSALAKLYCQLTL